MQLASLVLLLLSSIFLSYASTATKDDAALLETFKKNGIHHELYGIGRLIQGNEQCRPWTMNLFQYLSNYKIEGISEYGKIILKRRLYASFAKICQNFDVPTDVTVIPDEVAKTTYGRLKFLEQFDMSWNILKFERDLKSLFLEQKIITAFADIITEEQQQRFGVKSPTDFIQQITVFPTLCNVTELSLQVRACQKVEHPTMGGKIYATAHVGQFVNGGNAYIYYNVPEYIIINNDKMAVVDISTCKVVYGSYIYCFHSTNTNCNMNTMAGCQLKALKTSDNFMFNRTVGTSTLHATTVQDPVIYDSKVIHLKQSPGIFVSRATYKTTEKGHEIEEVTFDELKENDTNVNTTVLGETLHVLTETEPTSIWRVNRKGMAYFSHKMPRPTVWDDVRDFFMHII